MTININTPIDDKTILNLKSGDIVSLTGFIYTARDAAHKKMVEDYNNSKTLPFDIKNKVIYYAGPAPAKPGQVIGSVGPTTSGRMDAYAPILMNLGLKGMIGKGLRSQDVINSMKKNKAVYLGATGGAAALISSCVISSEIIAYEHLGAEAIRKLYVKDMPLVVIIDSYGNSLYDSERLKYKNILKMRLEE